MENHESYIVNASIFDFTKTIFSDFAKLLFYIRWICGRLLLVLEDLTRLQPQQLTKTFVALKVAFPDDVSIEDFPHITKLDQYFSPTHSKLSRDYGTEWLTQKRSLILRAPSAAMHHEFNYMINTRHELFPNVNIDDVLSLDIDPRVYSNTR